MRVFVITLYTVCLLPFLSVSIAHESPDVTHNEVNQLFGGNLNTATAEQNMLLLAIAVEQTNGGKKGIGIPYIIESGPDFWVQRLNTNTPSVQSLMNNALLVLFTNEEIPDRNKHALRLIQLAANSGYWPAQFYVAEQELKKGKFMDNHVAFGNLQSCAVANFVPCIFRIGFWLLESPQRKQEGIDTLKLAIYTATSDIRYKGYLKQTISLASKAILKYSPTLSLSPEGIDHYRSLSSIE